MHGDKRSIWLFLPLLEISLTSFRLLTQATQKDINVVNSVIDQKCDFLNERLIRGCVWVLGGYVFYSKKNICQVGMLNQHPRDFKNQGKLILWSRRWMSVGISGVLMQMWLVWIAITSIIQLSHHVCIYIYNALCISHFIFLSVCPCFP